MVDRLLPGVTTVTDHATYFILHPLVWAEAKKRGLDLAAARELIRRCEVVVAGVSALHGPHHLPVAHGEDRIRPDLIESGVLRVSEVQQPGSYAAPEAGFFGAYRGSEERLGLLSPGSGGFDSPGGRFNEQIARRGMEGIFELAAQDEVRREVLESASNLCVCQAFQGSVGQALRTLLCAPDPSPDYRKLDSARQATARLIGRMLRRGPLSEMEGGFSKVIRSGSFIVQDPVASDILESRVWRGVALRNFTVGAWRRIWSLAVEQLDEPRSRYEIAERLASEVGEGEVGDLLASLPESMDGDIVLDAEGELRSQAPRRVDVEIALLALSARRVDELDDETARAYSPRPQEVLSPHWLKAYLTSRISDPMRTVVSDLVERLVDRAMRVALSKMETRPDGVVWLPTRVKERDGTLYRISTEGWGDVGLRIASFSNVLASAGVLDWSQDGWTLSPKGESLIG